MNSAETLKKFLNNQNNQFNNDATRIKQKIQNQNLDKNIIFITAMEIFNDFLNVVNYPSHLFKDQFNSIISKFSFSELRNPNSELSIEILKLKKAMDHRLRIEESSIKLYR